MNRKSNLDLIASHQILSLLETSKSIGEALFDLLPLSFCIIIEEGSVLKANHDCAKLFNIEFEKMLGQKFQKLTNTETWDKVSDAISEFSKNHSEEFEFESQLQINGATLNYLWSISPFGKSHTERDARYHNLFCIVGRDITDLRKAYSESFKLAKDLELAGLVQTLLIPKEETISSPHINIKSFYKSAKEAGGDWWQHYFRKDGSALIAVGDVTGHGMGPAMVTSIMVGAYCTLRSLGILEGENDIERAFHVLDENLSTLCKGKYWMSFSLLEINPLNNELNWWSAGAPPIIILRESGQLEAIHAMSTLLGNGNISVHHTKAKFLKGDKIFIFTDGIYDFNMKTNSPCSYKVFEKLCASTKELSAKDAQQLIINELDVIRGTNHFNDDRTLITIEMS